MRLPPLPSRFTLAALALIALVIAGGYYSGIRPHLRFEVELTFTNHTEEERQASAAVDQSVTLAQLMPAVNRPAPAPQHKPVMR